MTVDGVFTPVEFNEQTSRLKYKLKYTMGLWATAIAKSHKIPFYYISVIFIQNFIQKCNISFIIHIPKWQYPIVTTDALKPCETDTNRKFHFQSVFL